MAVSDGMWVETQGDKIAQGRVMMKLVRQLEIQGWRVRRGPWPSTLACAARWDFAYNNRMLFPLNTPAARAMKQLPEVRSAARRRYR
jgi:hypothetical protein